MSWHDCDAPGFHASGAACLGPRMRIKHACIELGMTQGRNCRVEGRPAGSPCLHLGEQSNHCSCTPRSNMYGATKTIYAHSSSSYRAHAKYANTCMQNTTQHAFVAKPRSLCLRAPSGICFTACAWAEAPSLGVNISQSFGASPAACIDLDSTMVVVACPPADIILCKRHMKHLASYDSVIVSAARAESWSK